MKILVTGASGYVGNRLAHTLAERGHIVHALIRTDSARQYLVHPRIQIFEGDILDKKSLGKAMNECTQIYHTAALVKLWSKNRDEFYEHNVGGTINVLATALENDIEKLVYTSSCCVWSAGIDHPITENDPRIDSFDNDYDLSKHLAEKAVREYCNKGLCTVIVNPSRIYGLGIYRESNGVNRFLKMILKNKISFLPGTPETIGNYVYLDDVVNGHILAMEKGSEGERYILGGHNISFRQIINTIINVSKRKKYFIHIPERIIGLWGIYESCRAGLRHTEPRFNASLLRRFNLHKAFDTSKAQKQLGYTITDFEESITKTINFLK